MTATSPKQRLDDLLAEGPGRENFGELTECVYDSYANVDLIDRRIRQMEEELEAGGDDVSRDLVEALGILQFARGSYGDAARTLLPVHSRKVASHFLGRACLRMGQGERAIGYLEASREGDDDLQSDVYVIEACVNLRDPEQAEKVLARHSKADECANLRYAKGMVADLNGEYGEAIEHYEAGVKLDAEHAGCLFRLALNYDLNGEDERALELYERCANLKPTYVGALMNMGILYEDLGKYYEAAHCYKRVLAIDPRHQQAQMYLKDAESSLSMYLDVSKSRRMRELEEVFSLPLSGFELSSRSRNALDRRDIKTIGGLTQVTREELLNEKNFGDTSLEEIEGLLSRYDLQIGGQEEYEEGEEPGGGLEERAAAQEKLNTPIESLEFSTRCRKCMERLGIKTVGELVQQSEKELLAVPNFGATSLNEIVQVLGAFGLSLRSE
jgi:DNA-directed RNA polymerase subunit alpha